MVSVGHLGTEGSRLLAVRLKKINKKENLLSLCPTIKHANVMTCANHFPLFVDMLSHLKQMSSEPILFSLRHCNKKHVPKCAMLCL